MSVQDSVLSIPFVVEETIQVQVEQAGDNYVRAAHYVMSYFYPSRKAFQQGAIVLIEKPTKIVCVSAELGKRDRFTFEVYRKVGGINKVASTLVMTVTDGEVALQRYERTRML